MKSAAKGIAIIVLSKNHITSSLNLIGIFVAIITTTVSEKISVELLKQLLPHSYLF